MNLSNILKDLREKRILKEALDIYHNILINGTTDDGINYTYTINKDIEYNVLNKLKELVESDSLYLNVKYLSVNFVPSHTFTIHVPVVDKLNTTAKTLHK